VLDPVELSLDKNGGIQGTVACDISECATIAISYVGTRFDGQEVSGSGAPSADGTFALADLAAGTYAVTATHDHFQPATGTVTVAQGQLATLGPLTLVAQRGSLSGTVLVDDALGQGVQVSLNGVAALGEPVTRSTLTDQNGAFALQDVLVGSYTVTASLADHSSDSQSVTVSAQITQDDIQLALFIKPGSITGTVSLEGGVDTDGATVDVDGQQSTLVNSDGTFELTEIAPGIHTVTARATEYYDSATVVQVKADTATEAPPLLLSRSRGNLVGSVHLDGENAHGGVLVTATDGNETWETTSQSDGSFALAGLPTGDGYSVRASYEGFMPA